MPRPYSTDLRDRVVAAADGGMSYDEIAERFDIGRSTVGRWLRRRRDTGSVAPGEMGGPRNVKLDAEMLETLRTFVEKKPDAILEELADMLAEETGMRVDPSTIFRGLARAGITRKKRQ